MSTPPAPMGHNNPPQTVEIPTVAALLATYPKFAARWDEITGRVKWDRIGTPEEAGIAGRAIIDARDLWNEIDAAREARKAPYLAATRTIDTWFGDFLKPIGEWGKKLNGMIQVHTDRAEAAAAAERRRLADEAAKAQRVGTLIQANAERAPVVKGVAAEDAAAAHFNRAEEARTAAALTTAAPVSVAGGGSVGKRTEWVATVEDYPKAVLALLKIAPDKIKEAVDKEAQRLARAGTRTLDGVKIAERTIAQVRR